MCLEFRGEFTLFVRKMRFSVNDFCQIFRILIFIHAKKPFFLQKAWTVLRAYVSIQSIIRVKREEAENRSRWFTKSKRLAWTCPEILGILNYHFNTFSNPWTLFAFHQHYLTKSLDGAFALDAAETVIGAADVSIITATADAIILFFTFILTSFTLLFDIMCF